MSKTEEIERVLDKFSPEEIEAYHKISDRLKERVTPPEKTGKNEMADLLNFYDSAGDVDFLAKISHEMRTPLNAIVGMINLLKLEITQSEQLEKLNILDYSTRQLSGIIHNFIDVTSIQLGQINVQEGNYDFYRILSNAIDTYRPDAKMRGGHVFFESNFEDGLILYFDKNRITQVLNNVLHTCVNECQSSRILVQADTTYSDADKVNIELRVGNDKLIDNLNGNYRENFREMSSPDVNFALRTAENLANFFGGQMEFFQDDSGNVGVYTTFTFSRAKAEEPLPPKESEKLKVFPGKKILLVEDVEVNVMIAKRFLEKLEIQTTVAVDGEMAMKTLQENNFDFDLVLLDIYMPKKDGFYVIQSLRKDLNIKEDKLPVIAVTASTEPRVIENIKNGYFQDVLYKPYIIEDLVKILDKQLA